jgi:hypothetical protein
MQHAVVADVGGQELSNHVFGVQVFKATCTSLNVIPGA